MLTENSLEEEPAVCIYPKWRFKNQFTHNMIMLGLTVSINLIVFPAAFLFEQSLTNLLNDEFKKYLAVTLGVGITGAMMTGVAFFSCTKAKKNSSKDNHCVPSFGKCSLL